MTRDANHHQERTTMSNTTTGTEEFHLHSYTFISGDSFNVHAATEEEAEAKYAAYHNGDPCPCGETSCTCVQDSECLTSIEQDCCL